MVLWTCWHTADLLDNSGTRGIMHKQVTTKGLLNDSTGLLQFQKITGARSFVAMACRDVFKTPGSGGPGVSSHRTTSGTPVTANSTRHPHRVSQHAVQLDTHQLTNNWDTQSHRPKLCTQADIILLSSSRSAAMLFSHPQGYNLGCPAAP